MRRRIDLQCATAMTALDAFFGPVIGVAIRTQLELEGSQLLVYWLLWLGVVALRAVVFFIFVIGYLRPVLRKPTEDVAGALAVARRAPLKMSYIWAGSYGVGCGAVFAALIWLRPLGISPHAEFLGSSLLITVAIFGGSWAICFPLMHALLWNRTCELATAAQADPVRVATRVISFRARMAVLAVCLGNAPLLWTLGMGLSVDGAGIRERAGLRAELAAARVALALPGATPDSGDPLVATFVADGRGRILHGDAARRILGESVDVAATSEGHMLHGQQRALAIRRVSPDLLAGALVEIEQSYTTAYLLAGFLSLLVVAAWAPLCGWFISLSAARPISQIARLTGDISRKGHIDATDRLPETHSDELGDLAAGTNRMLTRLQDSIAQISEKERLEKEMEIANRLQTSILPRTPVVDGLEIAAVMVPASEVGGDYYDILPVEGGCWLGIGDVAGHGLTSGLLMLQTQSAVGAIVEHSPDASPRDVVVGVNKVLFENIRKRLRIDDHMTMSLLRYHRDGRIDFAGAHEDIVIWRAATRTCETITTPGTWLGLTVDVRKATIVSSCRLLPGDLLLLYTDGVIEAKSAARELLGLERLCAELAAVADRPAQAICDHLLEYVRAWMAIQYDDITLLVARYQ